MRISSRIPADSQGRGRQVRRKPAASLSPLLYFHPSSLVHRYCADGEALRRVEGILMIASVSSHNCTPVAQQHIADLRFHPWTKMVVSSTPIVATTPWPIWLRQAREPSPCPGPFYACQFSQATQVWPSRSCSSTSPLWPQGACTPPVKAAPASDSRRR